MAYREGGEDNARGTLIWATVHTENQSTGCRSDRVGDQVLGISIIGSVAPGATAGAAATASATRGGAEQVVGFASGGSIKVRRDPRFLPVEVSGVPGAIGCRPAQTAPPLPARSLLSTRNSSS
jgi:hypothetical protein